MSTRAEMEGLAGQKSGKWLSTSYDKLLDALDAYQAIGVSDQSAVVAMRLRSLEAIKAHAQQVREALAKDVLKGKPKDEGKDRGTARAISEADVELRFFRCYAEFLDARTRGANQAVVDLTPNLLAALDRYREQEPAPRIEMTRGQIVNEYSARAAPQFGELEAEDQARSIEVAAGMAASIEEGLTSAFDRDVHPVTRQAMHKRWAAIDSDVEAVLALAASRSSEATTTAVQRLNVLRTAASNTIANTSEAGLARENWERTEAYKNELSDGQVPVTEEAIRDLNRRLAEGLANNEGTPGDYRLRMETAGIAGAYLYPGDIPSYMTGFMNWYNANVNRHPIELAALSYQRLVSIHPFADANGRTARMVQDWILDMNGYPPALMADVNVAVFGGLAPYQSNPGQEPTPDKNVTPDEAVERVTAGVERALRALRESLELG